MSVTDQPLTWEVQSADGKYKHSVTSVQKTCPHNCSICCPDCNICIHMYMCSCADALIRTTICKHIHLVSRLNHNPKPNHTHRDESLQQHSPEISSDKPSPIPDTAQNINVPPQEETKLLENLQEKTQLCSVTALRNDVQKQISALVGQLHFVCDIETLRDIRSYVSSAINHIKGRYNHCQLLKLNQPTN